MRVAYFWLFWKFLIFTLPALIHFFPKKIERKKAKRKAGFSFFCFFLTFLFTLLSWLVFSKEKEWEHYLFIGVKSKVPSEEPDLDFWFISFNKQFFIMNFGSLWCFFSIWKVLFWMKYIIIWQQFDLGRG